MVTFIFKIDCIKKYQNSLIIYEASRSAIKLTN
jgi:hypothetical protein